ncbi:MAG: 4-(cytidine 5'-diphospho)-2-C-methyl-D-erythritol kinase [Psychrobacter sp.]|nr:4-(cytidine 5'-diphospho)-2-C-methyl-D-erythritol kinase [Psychrobacter sp.]
MASIDTPLNSLITRLSPAKINLFLHITGKRSDGYHNLQTVFRLLDWGDYLHFLPSEIAGFDDIFIVNSDITQQAISICKKLIIITGADSITVRLEDNLIFKAAHALLLAAIEMQKLPEHLQKVTITLDKRLPMGAGLGGGSSNAATTLLALNEIWQFNLSRDELIKIATTIGADVPIFIFGQDAIAMGIGEQLTSISLPDQHYLVLTPNAHVNTAKLFAHPELQRNMIPLSIENIKDNTDDYVQHLNTPYQNVFTPVVAALAPAVSEALIYLQNLELQAQATARMTGSGSTLFLPLDRGIVDDKALLNKWIVDAPCPAFLVNNLLS